MPTPIKPIAAAASLAVFCLSLTACQYRSKSDTYYLVAPNLKLPYWKAVQQGFKQAATEFQVTAQVQGPDTYDPKAEEDALDTAIRAHPAGILVSAADAAVLSQDIRAATSSGIPVLTVDSDAPLSSRLFFVGTNNLEAGHLGGRRLVERLHGKGKIVVYSIPGQPNLDERLKGYKDILAENPGITIVDVLSTGGDSGSAFDRTNQYVNRTGADKIDAFVALESSSGTAIAEVLKRNNVTDRVVIAMDVDADTLKYIEDGTIDSTISQKPFTMGYVGLRELDAIHHDQRKQLKSSYVVDSHSPFPAFIDTGSALITKYNVSAFQTTAAQ